jgi:hypothetical protein
MDEQVKRKAEIIEPPESRVKLRADFDGFKIDEAALARAEIVIESMGNDYLAWPPMRFAISTIYTRRRWALMATATR